MRGPYPSGFPLYGHRGPILAQVRESAPPQLPLRLFGPFWENWISAAADAAACSPDYVAAPLLALASVLIGNARWAQATPGWAEPPHLWLGVVGDSGSGKSPGADCLLGEVLPVLEDRMLADYPDRLREWFAHSEMNKASWAHWRRTNRAAPRGEFAMPAPPPPLETLQPQAPRLRQNDVTVEKVADLLATAAPKGLLIVRDELAGWIAGMNAYRGGGRQFWLEAYGGRPYRVERKCNPNPIVVPRLAVGVYGGIQPERLAPLLEGVDDGLIARFLWVWPETIPFRLSRSAPCITSAIRALDRLRELDLSRGAPAVPVMMPLADEAHQIIKLFGRRMQVEQLSAQGPLRSAFGKARGQALRLSLVMEMLWWCGEEGASPPPLRISAPAIEAACHLVAGYFMHAANEYARCKPYLVSS